MKKILLTLAMVLALSADSKAQWGVSFGVFYDGLGPHGEWISITGGTYAWRPVGVAVSWRPYTLGRWCWTDDGWYWASDEPWGWATYHYGRWYYDDIYGWIWIPGYDWAPAWVEWRYGGGYVGWAPLPPYAVWSVGYGVIYRTHWEFPHHWWNFVDYGHICSPQVHRYVYRSDHNRRFIGNTRGGGNVRFDGGRGGIVSRGPEPGYIERRGNVRLERAEIREVKDRSEVGVIREGGRERIAVYRPDIREVSRDGARPAADRPANVRETERKIDLDTRRIDAPSNEALRTEGRDLRRAEEFRHADETERWQQRRPVDRGMDPPVRRNDGSVRERSDVEPQPESRVKRDDSGRSSRPQRTPEQVDRPRREEFRSPEPERTMRRPPEVAPRQAPREMPRSEGRGRGDAPRGGGERRGR